MVSGSFQGFPKDCMHDYNLFKSQSNIVLDNMLSNLTLIYNPKQEKCILSTYSTVNSENIHTFFTFCCCSLIMKAFQFIFPPHQQSIPPHDKAKTEFYKFCILIKKLKLKYHSDKYSDPFPYELRCLPFFLIIFEMFQHLGVHLW